MDDLETFDARSFVTRMLGLGAQRATGVINSPCRVQPLRC